MCYLIKRGEHICLGYTSEDCVCCSRYRVLLYKSGVKVCEKCGTDQSTGNFVKDRYYSPFI
jgi:ribosomal protein L37AE/L43A